MSRIRDRAAVIATAVLQIITDAAPDELPRWLAEYLRDELADIERQIANDRELHDA